MQNAPLVGVPLVQMQSCTSGSMSGASSPFCTPWMPAIERQMGAPFHVPAPADVARWSQAYVDDPFYGGYDGERVWEGMLRKARRLQPDFAQ